MNAVSLPALPAMAFVVAMMVWALPHSQWRDLATKVTFVAQAFVGIYVIYLCVLAFLTSGGLHDASGVWLSVGDLFVEASFALQPPAAITLFVVWFVTSLCLWWRRESAASLLALQGSLWLCALATDLPVTLAGFTLAGFVLPHAQFAASSSLSSSPCRPYDARAIHRAADALALTAAVVWLLWVPSLSSTDITALAQDADETVLAPIVGLTAWQWLALLLCLALFLRTFAAFASWRAHRVSLAAGVLVVGQSGLWAWMLVPHHLRFVVVGFIGLGVAFAYGSQKFAAVTRLLSLLARSMRGIGLIVNGLQRWVFAGALLQAPVVIVDACARVLKLIAGGDIQRYAAIGLLGLAGLFFVSTRPAAPGALTVKADGLRVVAVAVRGTASASKLLYDYDFDGDDQIDRLAAGPSADFTYAAPGTYSISVMIRDPFWHTKRTLHAKVRVKK